MKELLVLSASRRTDLVACYPEVFVERLRPFPPDRVHSIVIWTKNPWNMLHKKELKEVLSRYRQVYVHLTITGMGGGEFEPFIPPWEELVQMLEGVVDLVKSPERVSWRFDPILEGEKNGRKRQNLDLFPALAESIAPLGVRSCRTSWVFAYRKVVARMARKGWRLLLKNEEERRKQARLLERTCRELGLELNFCAMEGFPLSRCIDGELLSRLHPDGLRCSVEKARGQRKHCGCTRSADIGWYTDRCKHECLYCYALP